MIARGLAFTYDEELMSCIGSLRRDLEECVPAIVNCDSQTTPIFDECDFRIIIRLCRVIDRLYSYSYLQTILRLAKRSYFLYEAQGRLGDIEDLAQLFQQETDHD